jgi:pimeloyl-ACP methyl ester carboxylesterase
MEPVAPASLITTNSGTSATQKPSTLPGHSTGKACHDIDSYLEWVRGFITARRYKDIVLCGHAMGGAITLLYALRYPEELKGIVLMGTGAGCTFT